MRWFSKKLWLIWLAAFFAGLAGALLWMREPMAPLTREALAAARERWRAAGVGSYELRYRMLRSEYVVRVRDGIVEEATVDGNVPTSGNWRAYGVEGLFDTLAQDLDNLADPAGPFAGGKPPILRVRFNPQLGYVERYIRSGGGQSKGASIEVIGFAPQDDSSPEKWKVP